MGKRTDPKAGTAPHADSHWADNGETSLTNSVLLCGFHHTAIHHRQWQVRITPDGLPEFTPPPWIDPNNDPSETTHTSHEPADGGRSGTAAQVPYSPASPRPGVMDHAEDRQDARQSCCQHLTHWVLPVPSS